MTDYGHDLLFGTVLTPDATHPDNAIELAVLAEQVGLDLVSLPDHPYRPEFLDALTLLTAIAARTTRIRVFPNVANLPLRPPAGLARAVASLDAISGGRAELGLGAGGYVEAIVGEGGPRRTPGESIDALTEALHVIRTLWTPGPPATYAGDYYALRDALPGPPKRHDIAIWIGAIKPRMLRLVGSLADGWLPSAGRVPPSRLAAGHAIIDEAARAAGTRPGDIRRLYNIPGSFGTASGFLQGAPRDWVEQLSELTLTHGMSGYLFPSDDPDTIRRFASEVVPGVRESVARERGATAVPSRQVSGLR